VVFCADNSQGLFSSKKPQNLGRKTAEDKRLKPKTQVFMKVKKNFRLNLIATCSFRLAERSQTKRTGSNRVLTLEII
jgi:hypothetical protein